MKDYITFEVAKIAKEKNIQFPKNEFYNQNGNLCIIDDEYLIYLNSDKKGYWDCNNEFEDDTKEQYFACIQSELQKILRDDYNIHIDISINGGEYYVLLYSINDEFDFKEQEDISYKFYEQALNKGLLEALNLIK